MGCRAVTVVLTRMHDVLTARGKVRAAGPAETGGDFLHILYEHLTAACEGHSTRFFTGQKCWCHTLALHSG